MNILERWAEGYLSKRKNKGFKSAPEERKLAEAQKEEKETLTYMLVVSVVAMIIGGVLLGWGTHYGKKVISVVNDDSLIQSAVVTNLFNGSYVDRTNLLDLFDLERSSKLDTIKLNPKTGSDWVENYDYQDASYTTYVDVFLVDSEKEVLGYISAKYLPLEFDFLGAYQVNYREDSGSRTIPHNYIILEIDKEVSPIFEKFIKDNGTKLNTNKKDIDSYIKIMGEYSSYGWVLLAGSYIGGFFLSVGGLLVFGVSVSFIRSKDK